MGILQNSMVIVVKQLLGEGTSYLAGYGAY